MPALRDATEYQFATKDRRLLVRTAHGTAGGVELSEAAREYAERLETFLDATDVSVGPVDVTAGGAKAVEVSATIPGADAADPGQGDRVRTALLRFGGGPVVEMTLQAEPGDAGAEGEFRRLLESARPAGVPDAVAEVARAIEAGNVGRADHPAGAIRLALTPDYRGPTSFALASADAAVTYRLEATSPTQETTRSAVTGTILGGGSGFGVGVATAEDGRPVRYEIGPRPRLSPGRTPEIAPGPEAAPAVRGPMAYATAAAGEAVVEGVVRGRPVRVRVAAPGGADPSADLGRELIRALNAPG